VPLTRIRQARRESGQTLVEFALVLPIILILLIGVVEFGIAWENDIEVTDAAREGSRAAVIQRINGQTAMVNAGTAAARGSASDLNQSKLTVSVTSGDGSWNQGDPIVTQVSYPYSISILGVVVASGTLTSSTTMEAE
jgi:Flp pilus assembly protein TadG